MITVYGFVPFDRSGRVRWLLEELGQPYTDHWLDFRSGEARSPAFLAISPLGRVPAVTCEGDVLVESQAILSGLARRFGTGSLNPAHHDADQYESWMALASCTLDPVCFEFARPDIPKAERPARRAQAQRDLDRAIFRALLSQIDAHGTMLPGGFSPVDIQVAASLQYADRGGALADQPQLAAWLQTMRERPGAIASKLFG